jgi:uncharacterized protein YaiI (UPF0178 family)
MSRKLYVDADACPVKSEVVSVANQFQCPVVMVASVAHEIQPYPQVEIIKVDSSSQSVDMYIINRISSGDILITGDYGLAAIALGKKAAVLSPTGREYTQHNMDLLLEERHANARIRRAGGKTRGPKAFGKEERLQFHISLTNLLRNIEGI